MLSLNCGSGQRKFGPPFVNVDINPKWAPDVLADISSMPMFEDASASIIVAHQVIEHVGLGEFDGAMREAHRILCPGGSLIITTPDLRALVKAWITGRINDYIFGVNLYGAYMDDEADRHRWTYHGDSLTRAIQASAPWAAVAPFDWRVIPGAEIARDWWVLGMEAVK